MRMKAGIILLILCISRIPLWSINRYEPKLIKKIPDGYEKGEVRLSIIGYQPGTYAIDDNDIFYIFDGANNRVNMYDLDLNYIGEIADKKEYGLSYAVTITFDNKRNFINFNENIFVEKINRNTQESFTISKLNNTFPLNTRSINNIFPYEDYIFFTNNKNEIFFVNDKGHILNDNETKVLLYHINNNVHSTLRDNKGLAEKLDEYLEQKKLVLIGDRLYHKDFSVHRNYYQFIRENIKNREMKDLYVINFNSDEWNWGIHFVGYDRKDNIYWYSGNNDRYLFFIANKYGEIIEYFRCERIGAQAKIDKYGNIYFISWENDGVSFYRIKNRWSNK